MIKGDTVREVLDYVEFDADMLVRKLRHDVELAVRVLAFEGHAAGGAPIHAVWELFNEKGLLHRGEFRSDAARWNGKDEASLAAALAIADLAKRAVARRR